MEGCVEFFYGVQSYLLEQGSVGYVAPDQLHGFHNTVKTDAKYFTVSIRQKY
jgi:mannose-6-phosphate isomerase-like protein (cupin superfamily)